MPRRCRSCCCWWRLACSSGARTSPRSPGWPRRWRSRWLVFGMPLGTVTATAIYGAAYGFLPIGWIVLNAVFLYNLTVATGQFEVVKTSVGRLSSDRRIQALLVAFSFGAFIEGASGFGTPVAICSALLIGLGLHAAVRGGAVAHRQHRAGGVRRHRHADPDAGGRDRIAGVHARPDGRPAAAVRLADRAGVAGRDDERVAGACGASGRRCWCAAGRSPSCSLPGATTSAPSSSTSSADLYRSPRSRSSAACGARRTWTITTAGMAS